MTFAGSLCGYVGLFVMVMFVIVLFSGDVRKTDAYFLYQYVGASSDPLPVSNESIASLVALTQDMQDRWLRLDGECSTSAVFADLYLWMTRGGLQTVQEGYYDDGNAMANLIVVFASRYIAAIDTYYNGSTPSPPWQQAFNFGATNRSSAYDDVMLGINAHINYDLGIAVYTSGYGDEWWDRKTDYDRINDLLANITDPSLCDMGTRYDATLKPTVINIVENEAVLQIFVEWRNNAWNNGLSLFNKTDDERSDIETNMSNQAVLIAQAYETPSLFSTAPSRIAYCAANHNTTANCPGATIPP